MITGINDGFNGQPGVLFGAPYETLFKKEIRGKKFPWTLIGVAGGALVLSIVALRSAPAYMKHATHRLQVKAAAVNTSSGALQLADAGSVNDGIGGTHALQPSLDFYLSALRGSLFSPPQPPSPPPAKPTTLPAPVAPMPVNPFADWAYTGTVHIGNETIALIENSKTGEGRYIRTGDSFLGAQVQNVSDQVVMMKLGDKPFVLTRSDSIVITPLDKNAEVPQQTNTQAQNTQAAGQPQAPTMSMPMMGGSVPQFNPQQYQDRAAMRAYWRQMRQMGGGRFSGGRFFNGGPGR
ncbi:hypothetical protein [Chthonomonas calidirosea]|uniref:hypothetical protein n=1 Tax=Chthonomonas calidirosea TaxID=454171 RepID=UPI0006EC878C|nr:hypothetical protein [Chthonomonas calidirosea]CEK14818.1 hypothetical protein CP488_00959 [Chthonomonas calidirosea]